MLTKGLPGFMQEVWTIPRLEDGGTPLLGVDTEGAIVSQIPKIFKTPT